MTTPTQPASSDPQAANETAALLERIQKFKEYLEAVEPKNREQEGKIASAIWRAINPDGKEQSEIKADLINAGASFHDHLIYVEQLLRNQDALLTRLQEAERENALLARDFSELRTAYPILIEALEKIRDFDASERLGFVTTEEQATSFLRVQKIAKEALAESKKPSPTLKSE